jgi:hypothetical protein
MRGSFAAKSARVRRYDDQGKVVWLSTSTLVHARGNMLVQGGPNPAIVATVASIGTSTVEVFVMNFPTSACDCHELDFPWAL